MYSPFETKIELTGVLKYVYKTMGKAIAEYNMVESGDRILVAVSGGADSLSLLKLFQLRQARIPLNFEIIACFVDADFIKVDKNVLIDYFEKCKVRYVIKSMSLPENEISCFTCSWNRRKLLFQTAQEFGCNKVAFGHNMDDLSETILMNMCFSGELSVCPPSLEMFSGVLRIIRPLCYVEKRRIKLFASRFDFPNTHYDCPVGKDSRRAFTKNIIEQLEKESPTARKNIVRSLKNIKQGYLM